MFTLLLRDKEKLKYKDYKQAKRFKICVRLNIYEGFVVILLLIERSQIIYFFQYLVYFKVSTNFVVSRLVYFLKPTILSFVSLFITHEQNVLKYFSNNAVGVIIWRRTQDFQEMSFIRFLKIAVYKIERVELFHEIERFQRRGSMEDQRAEKSSRQRSFTGKC